jgi:intein/homing endonuclease
MSIDTGKSLLAYLIGALADGSIYHNKEHYVHRVTYYQQSKDYLLNCIESRILKLYKKKGHFFYDIRKNVYFYEITSKEIYLSFKEAIESFKDKTDRKVPTWIKNGDESIRFSFIRGFFDADGFYYINPDKSDFRVRFGQSEFKILSDIKEMFSMEIKFSKVLGPYQSKMGVKPYFELHIHGIDQVHKFCTMIKPCHPKKQLYTKS